jgi:hypothetical protein
MKRKKETREQMLKRMAKLRAMRKAVKRKKPTALKRKKPLWQQQAESFKKSCDIRNDQKRDKAIVSNYVGGMLKIILKEVERTGKKVLTITLSDNDIANIIKYLN